MIDFGIIEDTVFHSIVNHLEIIDIQMLDFEQDLETNSFVR